MFFLCVEIRGLWKDVEIGSNYLDRGVPVYLILLIETKKARIGSYWIYIFATSILKNLSKIHQG